MEEKVAKGETYLTRIHHRETINLLIENKFDAGPVWITEALYQKKKGTLNYITIPKEHDVIGRYFIGLVKKRSQHPIEAGNFIKFMTGETAKKILADYGFGTAF